MAHKPITFVVNERGCHVCTSHKPRSRGYPNYRYKGMATQMHRALYQEKHGELPRTTVVRHTCDDRMCINLAHLLTGSVADNNRDRHERGRTRNGGKACGHPGEKNPAAKLTQAQVDEILASGENNCVLGRKYGVTHQNIWCVRHGKTWRTNGAVV